MTFYCKTFGIISCSLYSTKYEVNYLLGQISSRKSFFILAFLSINLLLARIIMCDERIYPNLDCHCGFRSYNATYHSSNLGKNGSIKLFNTECIVEKSECLFRRCVLHAMNILEVEKHGNISGSNKTKTSIVYSMASESVIDGHLNQAFTGRDVLKNFLTTADISQRIFMLQSLVPKTETCEDAEWSNFFSQLDLIWNCGVIYFQNMNNTSSSKRLEIQSDH